jgi:hypothetical protein
VSTAFLGRGLVIVGIVAGLLAVSLPFADGARYVDDGTAAAFLIVLLASTSLLPAEAGRDLVAAAAGSAAFGFFLFIPAVFAFDNLGRLEAGAWLGVGTALIPIGCLLVLAAGGKAASTPAIIDRGPGLLVSTVGLVLIAVGIWLDVGSDGPTYWGASSSGHAVGIVLLVLVVVDAVLIAAAAHSSIQTGDLALLAAAVAFGYAVFAVVGAAFGDFASLGPGGWIETCGGVLLLGGLVLARFSRSRSPAPAAVAAG